MAEMVEMKGTDSAGRHEVVPVLSLRDYFAAAQPAPTPWPTPCSRPGATMDRDLLVRAYTLLTHVANLLEVEHGGWVPLPNRAAECREVAARLREETETEEVAGG
jgi:hypothetical protein